jgi:hypothetical protein
MTCSADYSRSIRCSWRTILARRIFAIVIALGIASPVFAQTWRVQFPANPAHATAQVASYDYVLTLQGGSALPAQTLGKPDPVSGTITVDVTAQFASLAPGTYAGQIRANGPGGQVLSVAGPTFQITIPPPGPQGAPTFIRTASNGPLGNVGAVPPATPFRIAYDHDGDPPTRYRLERNGDLAGTVSTVEPFVIGGLPIGVYAFEVTAEYASVLYTSAPLVVTVS